MKRRKKVPAKATNGVIADFRVVILGNPDGLVERISRAARKGGASEDDLTRLANLAPLLRSLSTKAGSKRRQELSIRARNARLAITDDERNRAHALNAELLAELPVKTPRYREIADRMNIKPDRVRSIFEGRRPSRKK